MRLGRKEGAKISASFKRKKETSKEAEAGQLVSVFADTATFLKCC